MKGDDFFPTDEEIVSLCQGWEEELQSMYVATMMRELTTGKPSIYSALEATFAAGRKVGMGIGIGMIMEERPNDN